MAGAALNRGASRQDWATPPELIDAVTQRFGPLTIDLAARADNTKAPAYIDPATDSLAADWPKAGRAWLNPPFSGIGPWARKCAEHTASTSLGRGLLNGLGRNLEILFLVPASVGANWFRDHVYERAAVLALNGRVTFVGAKDPYPKDLILCVYGPSSLWLPRFSVWDWRAARKAAA